MNGNPRAGSQDSIYVMGRTSEEYERLRRQSELLESITGSVLDRVGLGLGMRCLDWLRSGGSHTFDGRARGANRSDCGHLMSTVKLISGVTNE
jgi:hypothetical protein